MSKRREELVNLFEIDVSKRIEDLSLGNLKKVIGFSLGLVFLFYLLNILSELSTNVEFLKYFSVYTLCDTRNIITNIKINPICIILSILITALLIVLSYIRYDKKELV